MMKKQLTLNITKPCAEKWNSFRPTSNGGYCSSCAKNVIDFTKMTDREISDFFAHKPSQTCGRFRPEQLKTYSSPIVRGAQSRFRWLQTGLLTLLFLLTNRQLSANSLGPKAAVPVVQVPEQQTNTEIALKTRHKIKGLVVDHDKEPLPGVTIVLQGDTVGTITDINGEFKFPKELEEGDVLIFNYIGFETNKYVVPKDAPDLIEIPMMIMLYEELTGEVSIDEVYQAPRSGFSTWWQKLKELF